MSRRRTLFTYDPNPSHGIQHMDGDQVVVEIWNIAALPVESRETQLKWPHTQRPEQDHLERGNQEAHGTLVLRVPNSETGEVRA